MGCELPTKGGKCVVSMKWKKVSPLGMEGANKCMFKALCAACVGPKHFDS